MGNQSMDALLDLCEDPQVDIRKQAIKDLPTLCRDNKTNLPKITDVLTQVTVSSPPSRTLGGGGHSMGFRRKRINYFGDEE